MCACALQSLHMEVKEQLLRVNLSLYHMVPRTELKRLLLAASSFILGAILPALACDIKLFLLLHITHHHHHHHRDHHHHHH